MNATILMSGGLDSSACAHYYKQRGYDVRGVHVSYGQPAEAAERRAMEQVCKFFGIRFSAFCATGSEKYGTGELFGRNLFLISCAMCLGKFDAGILAMGIHAGTPYYDCSPAFFELMSRVVAEHTDGRLQLAAPFLLWDKGEIVRYVRETDIPVQLTYSCEAGTPQPCGKCLSCLDRVALAI